MAFEELKQRQSVMWGNGPYERVTDTLADAHDVVVGRIAAQPGERWLDLATGTGAVAKKAARAGAAVTGIDLSPALIETAKREAARCYRCDAETGSSDYSVRTREDIFVMARSKHEDARKQRAVFTKRLTVSKATHFHPEVASLDDIVFLPANLSRLVIDPYRDACRVETGLGGGRLTLRSPFLVGGLDEAPEAVRRAATHAVTECGLAYVGRSSPAEGVPWLQLLGEGEQPDATAAAVITRWPDRREMPGPDEIRPLQGIAAAAAELPEAIPFALEAGYDLLVLEGSGPLAGAWPELSGAPDLSVLRDAIRILRELNREEDIELLYFGGVRSGTDAAKLIGLGANAVIVGMSLALAVGGQIDNGSIAFYGDIEQADRNEKAELFLNALRTEASIMPRCTGKTVIHNLEPEDLRSISVVTAQACGIPLAGFNPRLAAASS